MVSKSCYVFIDSSNLFYGGKGRLGWKVDYERLAKYFKKKYKVKKIYYYSGVEAHGYDPIMSSLKEYPINELISYLKVELDRAKGKDIEYLKKDIARAKFLKTIRTFGYILRLKPIKHIRNYDGSIKSKSNCDVDLSLDVIRLKEKYDSIILCSGDGDFEILLRYLKELNKDILIIGNMENTAGIYKSRYYKELKDFGSIRRMLDKKKWEDAP